MSRDSENALRLRDQEARAVIEASKTETTKIAGTSPFSLRYFMNGVPFEDRAVAERVADGLLKAGVPPAPIRGGYLPAFKENQLTGEEIKRLLFGSTISGYITYPQQFRNNYKENGECTWEGPPFMGWPGSDIGKSRIDGDTICWQYQKRFWGIEHCGTVFRYPGGAYEGKDEYFWCSDFGFWIFSAAR
jgi:hypothetical protein